MAKRSWRDQERRNTQLGKGHKRVDINIDTIASGLLDRAKEEGMRHAAELQARRTAPKKREGMLLDTIQSSKDHYLHFPQSHNHVLEARYRAKRFVFSNEVTIAIAEMLRENPQEFLINNVQFALPPYETCYIEFDLEVFLKALGAPTTSDLERWRSSGKPDKSIGYLFDNNHLYVLTTNADDECGIVTPISYTFDKHHAMAKSAVCAMPSNTEGLGKNDFVLALYLAGLVTNEKIDISREVEDYLVEKFKVWFDSSHPRFANYDKDPKLQEAIHVFLQTTAGDIKNWLCFMLWINQPSIVHFEGVALRRGWVGNKHLPFLAHNIVRLRKDVTRRRMIGALMPRQSPRRHEVRWQYKNYNKPPFGCEHEWPIMPDEKGRWHCPKCGQWRIRVEKYERGDASKGYVTKEYKA